MKLIAILAASVFTYTTASAQMDTLSHSLGIVLAKSVQSQGLKITSYDDFLAGFKAASEGEIPDSAVTQAQQNLQNSMAKASSEQSSAAKAEGETYLAENGKRPEITTTTSGLQYEVLQEGTGESPTATQSVTVHYTGKTLDGKVFDSSVDRGEPATFGLNQVIPGWTEGVQLMKPGAKYRFHIPSDLAYGDRGAGADIPPGATLVFDVELLSVN